MDWKTITEHVDIFLDKYHGLQDADRDDIRQEALAAIVQCPPVDNGEKLHRWVSRVVRYRFLANRRAAKRFPELAEFSQNGLYDGMAEFKRANKSYPEPAAPAPSILETIGEQLADLLARVKGEFSARDYAAFVRLAVDGQDARTVAEETGMNINSVRVAKYRVLARLREIAA